MTTTCTDPTSLRTIDPTVDMSIMMSAVVCTADGAYTWTTRNADGDTLRYRTNAEGDGVFYESASFFNQDGWDQLLSPTELKVGACSPGTRRGRIVDFFTSEGFDVTTGRVIPNATQRRGRRT